MFANDQILDISANIILFILQIFVGYFTCGDKDARVERKYVLYNSARLYLLKMHKSPRFSNEILTLPLSLSINFDSNEPFLFYSNFSITLISMCNKDSDFVR